MFFIKETKYEDSILFVIVRLFIFWIIFAAIFSIFIIPLSRCSLAGHDYGLLTGVAIQAVFSIFSITDIIFSFILSHIYNFIMLSKHKYRKSVKYLKIIMIIEISLIAIILLIFILYNIINDINYKYINKYSMLTSAFKSEDFEKAGELLDEKLDPSLIDWYYINNSNNIKIFKLFVSKDYSIDYPDNYGMTALHYSIKGDDDKKPEYGIVKYLLDNKADPNKIGEGNTPLELACKFFERRKNFDIIYLLLQYGADPNKIGNNISSFGYICELPDEKIVFAIHLLIQYGADLNKIDSYGKTILHYAVENNKYYAVAEILSLGINPNILDNDNNTPLSIAVNNDNNDIADIIIGYGGKIKDLKKNSIER